MTFDFQGAVATNAEETPRYTQEPIRGMNATRLTVYPNQNRTESLVSSPYNSRTQRTLGTYTADVIYSLKMKTGIMDVPLNGTTVTTSTPVYSGA